MSEQQTGVLIVDDEEPARAVLREMLGRLPGVRIVGECADGMEAVKAAAELHPDIVFLDIQMPRLDGFEVAELLDPAVAVVFVTAYDQYAVKAFEVRAVDYVLKPFSEKRLGESFERARERRRARTRADAAALAAASRAPGQFLSRVVVRDGPHIRVIPADFVTTEDGTGIVHTASVFGADDFRACKENNVPSVMVKDDESAYANSLAFLDV